MIRNIFLISVFLIGIVTVLNAQKVGKIELDQLRSSHYINVSKEADSLSVIMNKGYQFIEQKADKGLFGDSTFQRIYKSSEGRILEIDIIPFVNGANPALEIKGNKYYRINTITGKFKDIFTLWHLLNPTADITKASKNDFKTNFIKPGWLNDTNDAIVFKRSFLGNGNHLDVWEIHFNLYQYYDKRKANQ